MNVDTLSRALTSPKAARLALVWFAVGVSLLFAGCSREDQIARHTKRADGFYAAGDYDKARLEYLNVVQLDPRNTHAVGQLGNIFFENGVVLQAGAALEQALKLGATDARIHARLGALFAAGKRIDKAREQVRMALEADPKLEEALVLMADLVNDEASARELTSMVARLRMQQGSLPVFDLTDAIIALKRRDAAGARVLAEKAAAADPKSGAAQFVLAGILLAQTNQVAGEAALAKAAELSPPRSTRQIQYINFLLQRGATNEARAHLDQTIGAAPDFVPARLRKAQWLFAERDLKGASGEIAAILTRDPTSVEARLLEAQLHLSNREPAKADEIMQQLIRQFPDSEQLQYQAALTSLANQKPNDAQLRLDRAYELNPNVPEVVLLRGRLYLARGQAGETITSTQRLISTNANFRPAYQLLGDALVANSELDRALAVFREYERRFTNDPAGPHNIGLLHLRKKEVPPARTAFERAANLRGDFLPAIEQLVRLDLSETNLLAAVERSQSFVQRHPDVAEGRVLLAQALLANRQPQLAEPELDKSIQLKPSLESAYLLLAHIYNESNRRDEAIGQLQALIEKSPKEQRALMMLGLLYNSANQPQKAAENYEALLKVNGSFGPALNNLAYLYSEKLNNLDRAYELARKSRELQPNDPRIADTLGWILYRRGEFTAALVHLEESASQLPREAEVQYHLGMAHYSMAHEQPARSAFQLALRLDSAGAWKQDIDERLAVLETNLSNDSETVKRLEQMAKTRPLDVILLTRLAQAQEGVGRLDDALATFKRATVANPDAIMPLVGQARVTVAKGDAAGGLVLARKARDLAKRDAVALTELGRIAYMARDFSWSYALLQESVGGSKGEPRTQWAFAQSAIAVGRLDVAKSALEALSGTALSGWAESQLALIPVAAAGSLAPVPDAIASRLTAAGSDDLLANYLKARQPALSGNPDEAIRGLEGILRSYPQFTPAKRSLAVVLSSRPVSASQAEKLAREVREVQPNDPEMARVIGLVALNQSKYSYAADMLQEAARLLPSDAELLIMLGRANLESGRLAEARSALNKAQSLSLNDSQKQQVRQLLQQLEKR